MFERIFGIIRRLYYLLAIIITLLGVYWSTNTAYIYYQESKYHGDWLWADSLSSDIKQFNSKSNKGYIIFADTYVEIDKQFIKMPKEKQDKEVKEIQDSLYPRTTYDWTSLLFVFLTLPVAWIIHRITHWVIWGKIK